MSNPSNEIIDLTESVDDNRRRSTRRCVRNRLMTATPRRRRAHSSNNSARHVNSFLIRRPINRPNRTLNGRRMESHGFEQNFLAEIDAESNYMNTSNGLNRATINSLLTTRVGEEYTEIIDLTAVDSSDVIDLTNDDLYVAKPEYTIIREKVSKPNCNLTGSCTICLEEFKAKDECLVFNCKHSFHRKCVTNWLTLKNSCPLCRKPVS
eukprot:NODE_103_length_20051_cov_0.229401.p11 type:complete len:208 gc:universal NODE_103_length_20051_cov_0.229401:12278-12901(+)